MPPCQLSRLRSLLPDRPPVLFHAADGGARLPEHHFALRSGHWELALPENSPQLQDSWRPAERRQSPRPSLRPLLSGLDHRRLAAVVRLAGFLRAAISAGSHCSRMPADLGPRVRLLADLIRSQ